MQKNNNESLEILLNKIANELGFYVVRLHSLSLRNNSIEIMIDKLDESKISIEDCKLYNIALKHYSDNIGQILGNDYYFDISSPGIERPLVKLQDYEKFKNNVVLVRFKEKIEGKKKLQGQLIGIENGMIKLETNGKYILISYDNIQNANIVMTEEIFRKLLSKWGNYDK